MNRQELKDYAIKNFGFEHEVTRTIFAIDEQCKDDYMATTLMDTCLELAVRRDEE